MNRALFLDRDGVVNHEVGYLHRPADVRWVPGIFSLCHTAQRLGYKLVVVTNQSGIARGLYTEADFHTLMDWMRAEFLLQGVSLDAVYFCPYHPEYGVGPYKREHPDRKPGPGMLLRAARDLSLDLTRSILVGDRCSDIAAAHAAGLAHAFLMSGTETHPCPSPHQPIDSLAAVEAWLNTQPKPATGKLETGKLATET
jgi:D-glycero-D-manno-heptose 1,7-bisphosphate phosphatase